MLENGSFENGWEDIEVGGITNNQQPNSWRLMWLEPGVKLYNSEDKAKAVPECVHKHFLDLPDDEHPGQPGALVLDGEFVYKVFHGNKPFGAELTQVIDGLEPGSVAQISVPILLDAHGEPDPYGSEFGLSLRGLEQWHSIGQLGDREWNILTVEATVPENGQLVAHLLFKSKWDLPVDFFIDDIQFDCTPAEEEPGPSPGPVSITVIVPRGVEVIVEVEE